MTKVFQLEKLAPSKKICEQEDSEGRLNFLPLLAMQEAKKTDFLLGPEQVVALALTEICCEIGLGMVYWFPLPRNLRFPSNLKQKDGVMAYYQLPRAVYVPRHWGEEAKKTWRAMKHSERHQLLNAGGGCILSKEIVMPLAVTYNDIEMSTVRLNGYCTAEAGPLANLCIVPKAYVGWSPDLQRGAQFEISSPTIEDSIRTGGVCWRANVENLELYRAHDTKAVVQRLEDMYFEGKPRSLSRFGDILKVAIDSHHKWVTWELF